MSNKRACAVLPISTKKDNPFSVYVQVQTRHTNKIKNYVEERFLKTWDLEESSKGLNLLIDSAEALKDTQKFASLHSRKYISGMDNVETGHNKIYDDTMLNSIKDYLELSTLIKKFKIALDAAKFAAMRK